MGKYDFYKEKMDPKELKFSKIVKEHKNTIYAVCYMFSKDKDELNDLFQDILIKLWQGMETFSGENYIKTWIYRVSLNTCLDANRKKKRAGERIPLSVDIDPYEDSDADSMQIRQLYERINKLGLVDRSIILLWLEALSYEEIGEIVGISPKNVSVKLVRIREQLKKL